MQKYVSAGLQSKLLGLKQETKRTRNGKPILTLEASPVPTGRNNIQFFVRHTKQGPYIYINPDHPKNKERCLEAVKPQSIKDIMKLIEVSAFVSAIYMHGYDYDDEETESKTNLRVDNQKCLNKRVSCRQIKAYSGCQYMSKSSIRNRMNLAVDLGLIKKYTNLMTLDDLSEMKAMKIDVAPFIQESLKEHHVDRLSDLPEYMQGKIKISSFIKAESAYSNAQAQFRAKSLEKHKHGFFHYDPIPEKECIMTRAANTYSMSLESLYTEYNGYGCTVIINVSSQPNELFESVCKRHHKKNHKKQESLAVTGELNLFDNEPSSSYKKAETVPVGEYYEPAWNVANALRIVQHCVDDYIIKKVEDCLESEVAALDASSCSCNPSTAFQLFSKIQNELFANYIIYNRSIKNIYNSYNSLQLLVISFAREIFFIFHVQAGDFVDFRRDFKKDRNKFPASLKIRRHPVRRVVVKIA